MADQTALNPLASSSVDYWLNPQNWAKPVSGNELQSGTQSLNAMSSPSLESSAGSGFAAANQGVTGGGFGATTPAGSVPNTPAANNANGSNISNVENAAVGNNVASNNSTLGQQSNLGNIQNQLNSANQSSNSSSSNVTGQQQQAQQSGLPSSVFSSALSKLTGYTFPDLKSYATTALDNFGTNLGFAQSAANPLGLSAGSGFTGGDLSAISSDFGSSFGSAAAGATDALGGSLTFSSALGAAGLGYAGGSLLAGALGENATGGGIGGAGGAVIGAEIGSIIPGVGTIIGGLIGGVGGSLLGGLFGVGTPTSASEFQEGLSINGHDIGASYGAKNNTTGINQAIEGQLNTLIGGFADQFKDKSTGFIGFDPSIQIHGGVNTEHSGDKSQAGFFQISQPNQPDVNFNFNPQDSGSVATAYYNVLSTIATKSNFVDSQSLYNWFYGQPTQVGNAAASAGSNPALSNSQISIAPKGSSNAGSGPIIA